jgi:hypothetical protein
MSWNYTRIDRNLCLLLLTLTLLTRITSGMNKLRPFVKVLNADTWLKSQRKLRKNSEEEQLHSQLLFQVSVQQIGSRYELQNRGFLPSASQSLQNLSYGPAILTCKKENSEKCSSAEPN